MPIIQGMLYQSPDILFDTERLMKTNIRLLSTPLGENDLARKLKWLTQTNMFMAEILPVPQRFRVQRIYCALFTDSGLMVPVSENPIWSKISLQLEISGRIFCSGPAWHFAHPVAVLAGFRFHHVSTQPFEFWKQITIPTIDELVAQDRFSLVVNCDEPFPAYQIVGMLQGLITRAVG